MKRSESASLIELADMRFVQAKNGTRFFSESEILDLLESAEGIGLSLDEDLKTLHVAEIERLVNFRV